MADRSTWSVPDCPFAIEYATRALDNIRLEVTDAFFSLPRGGAEIGGILLGKWDEGRVAISGFAPLDCEHASGPSFTLSDRDRVKLTALIASHVSSGAQVTGWYHSHTRSDIFLSEADRRIYADFFPEPWQVALVLRPHALLPTRAGFFFRERDGSIRDGASRHEFTLEPLESRSVAAPDAAIPGISAAREVLVESQPSASRPKAAPPPSAIAAPPALAPSPGTSGAQAPADHPIPSFLRVKPPAPAVWPRVVIPLVIGAAIGAPAYLTRNRWMPRALATSRPAPFAVAAAPAPAGFGLNTIDYDGQLQIRWNRNAPAVVQAPHAILAISGVADPIALDHDHLMSGAFTVARQSQNVDVSLSVIQPDGRPLREVTSFIGKLPERTASKESVASQWKEARLAEDVAKIKSDLDAEIQRNKTLRKDVDFLGRQLHDQQRARLLNQAPDKK